MKFCQIRPKLIYINLLQCEHGFHTEERFLPNPYMLYVHDGRGIFVINRQAHNAGAGDLFFCREGMGNTIIADKADPFLLTGIDFDYMQSGAQNAFEDFCGFPVRMNLATDGFTHSLIHGMIKSYNHQTAFSQSLCTSLLKSFLLYTAELVCQPEQQKTLPAILNYLSDRWNRKVSLKELSNAFNYHPSTIERIVRSAIGMSVRQYQIECRMKKAIDYLIYSRKTITEIAELCGYTNIHYFSRQLKEKTGRRPSEYRNSMYEKKDS